jgi:hypothetical protein
MPFEVVPIIDVPGFGDCAAQVGVVDLVTLFASLFVTSSHHKSGTTTCLTSKVVPIVDIPGFGDCAAQVGANSFDYIFSHSSSKEGLRSIQDTTLKYHAVPQLVSAQHMCRGLGLLSNFGLSQPNPCAPPSFVSCHRWCVSS